MKTQTQNRKGNKMKTLQTAKVKDVNGTGYIIDTTSNETNTEILDKAENFYGREMSHVIKRTDLRN